MAQWSDVGAGRINENPTPNEVNKRGKRGNGYCLTILFRTSQVGRFSEYTIYRITRALTYARIVGHVPVSTSDVVRPTRVCVSADDGETTSSGRDDDGRERDTGEDGLNDIARGLFVRSRHRE